MSLAKLTVQAETTAPTQARQALFDQGFTIRSEVTGPWHFERLWTNDLDFARELQKLTTQAGLWLIWGGRPGLDKRIRPLLNPAVFVALGRSTGFAVHVRGPVRNGVTEIILEAIMHASAYAGFLAGLEEIRVAERAPDELRRVVEE